MNQKGSISRLIHEFSKLPGIGRKTAERLVSYILKEDTLVAKNLSEALMEVKKNIKFCRVCSNFSENDLCDICANPRRNSKVICIVEEPKDIWAIEKSGTYIGVYHVLMGSISPLDGVGPEDLRIKELIKRIRKVIRNGKKKRINGMKEGRKNEKFKRLQILSFLDREGPLPELFRSDRRPMARVCDCPRPGAFPGS